MAVILSNDAGSAVWDEALQEAESRLGQALPSMLKCYLLMLLMRSVREVSFLHEALGLLYLQTAHVNASEQLALLQRLGDACLLLSGLFPERARVRHVNEDYYVRLGKQSYAAMSPKDPSDLELCQSLSKEFVLLMDVLRFLRHDQKNMSDALMGAIELWQRTGSRAALAQLERAGIVLAALPKNSSLLQ